MVHGAVRQWQGLIDVLWSGLGGVLSWRHPLARAGTIRAFLIGSRQHYGGVYC